MPSHPHVRPPRLVHRPVFDKLSPAARAIIEEGFQAGWEYERISKEVLDVTGERVAGRTVAHYGAAWRAARMRLSDLVEFTLGAQRSAHLTARIDLAPGWRERHGETIRALLDAFLTDPTLAALQALIGELNFYALKAWSPDGARKPGAGVPA